MVHVRPRFFVLLAAAAALSLAVFAAVSPARSTQRVHIKGSSISSYKFAPKTVQIDKGDKVHWSWSSNAPHNVTFSGSKHSSTGADGNYTRKFRKKGTFTYQCTVHGFTGKVVVG